MKTIFSFKSLWLLTVLIIVIVFAQVFSIVRAQTTGMQLSVTCSIANHNVHGKLFSSTIGWIYLNCADYGPNIGNFGVDQDAQGFWNGYGWSNNVGWIKFGNGGNSNSQAVGCPSDLGGIINPAAGAAGCDVQKLPTLTGSNPFVSYPIVGWARACSATANPSTCSGPAGPGSGGWGGWISMSGLNDQNPTAAQLQTTSNYGSGSGASLAQFANPNTGQQTISGFVWGGDVFGWAKFVSAYVDTTNVQNAAHITLIATPSSVSGNNNTVLEYKINPAEASYFTGAACTATSTPSAGNSWNGSRANFSGSVLTIPAVTNVAVPANPTTYTISCPVVVPNSSQTVATASVTVTKTSPTISLSVGTHDLCVAGSLGGPQTTTASWISSSANASYCRLYQDGAVVGGNQNAIDSVTLGTFNSTTSNPYMTPVTSGSQHDYVVRCYDSNNVQILPESNHEFVGVASASFNGTTANGSLNCTQADWGITFGSSGAQGGLCNSNSPTAASLSWTSWGPVPNQYTYAVLKKNTNAQGNGTNYSTVGTFGLTDTAPSITTPGYYKVFYYTQGGVVAPVSSAQIYSSGQVSNTNCFSGLPSGGPYCPDVPETVNTSAILSPAKPKTYSWTSDAASCNLGSPNGSITLTGPGVRTLTCNWADGTSASSTASYGPMLAATSTFCSTPPKQGGNPVIIEN